MNKQYIFNVGMNVLLFGIICGYIGFHFGNEQGYLEGRLEYGLEVYDGFDSYCMHEGPITLPYKDVNNKSIDINILSYNICWESLNSTCVECLSET